MFSKEIGVLRVKKNGLFAKVSGLLLLGVLLLVFSCKKENAFTVRHKGKTLEVSLEKINDTLYHIVLTVDDKEHSKWPLEYPVYRFDYGDVTGNGMVDIAVGVIKPTRYFPTPDKRLFLFRITDDYYIRPLWLGSRVAQPLEDFRLTNEAGGCLIRTIEKEKSGQYLAARYRWKGFGLEFIDYLEREVPLSKAKKQLTKK